MHAYQLPTPDPRTTRRPRRVPRSRKHPRQDPHRAIAIEATVKLGVNVLLSSVAVIALANLIPYRLSQVAKLQELDVAVKATDERVQQEQAMFTQYFDPTQTRSLMQQTSNRIDPYQRQVVWQAPGKAQPLVSERASR